MRDVEVSCIASNENFSTTFHGRAIAIHRLNVQCKKLVFICIVYYFFIFDVIIQDPPDQVSIYGYDNTKPIPVGSTIVLTCVATGGNPKAVIKWERGSKTVKFALNNLNV